MLTPPPGKNILKKKKKNEDYHFVFDSDEIFVLQCLLSLQSVLIINPKRTIHKLWSLKNMSQLRKQYKHGMC